MKNLLTITLSDPALRPMLGGALGYVGKVRFALCPASPLDSQGGDARRVRPLNQPLK